MIRIAVTLALILLIGLMSYQNFIFLKEYRADRREFSDLKGQWDKLETANSKIEADLKYYESEDNLEKEARSQLNYKKSGEKMIIVVPKE